MKTRAVFFALTLALVPAAIATPPAFAQDSSNAVFKGFQSNSKGPVNVEADSLDVVEKDGQRISTFSGNVTVTRGDSVLKADKISIFSAASKPAADKTAKPADGSKPADAAKTADAKPADAKPADAKPADAAPAAATSSDSVMPGAGSFSRIEATGKVYVASNQQTATGDKAVVDMTTKLVTISGNVVLSQGDNVLTGDKLTWDMTTGRARVEQKPGGRIRGIFVPGNTPGQKP